MRYDFRVRSMGRRSVAPMDCLFCAIVSGEIGSHQVYADEHAIAFLDINPFTRGHTLVIPRRHVASVIEDDGALAEIAPAISTTSQLLVESLGADGLNLLSNAGAVSGQEVFHLHVHLVPRYRDRPGLGRLFDREPAHDLAAVRAQVLSRS